MRFTLLVEYGWECAAAMWECTWGHCCVAEIRARDCYRSLSHRRCNSFGVYLTSHPLRWRGRICQAAYSPSLHSRQTQPDNIARATTIVLLREADVELVREFSHLLDIFPSVNIHHTSLHVHPSHVADWSQEL